ncbi:hypothetical protein CERSUDRAFT_88750 [Gelatoporia subvermispora B]|uniref:Uncharacterized protein n=1 Tax=Ceriporiopsis subvermispora (strain B) TaxID=914234 RepID=M2P8D7_CERS8|nr:hypothetical protein CERSUDRAFT_88750 [Gelatoporia subvermispora B]
MCPAARPRQIRASSVHLASGLISRTPKSLLRPTITLVSCTWNLPSGPTAIAVVIICAHVKSIDVTSATCPLIFAQPVIQLASAEYFGGESFGYKTGNARH